MSVVFANDRFLILHAKDIITLSLIVMLQGAILPTLVNLISAEYRAELETVIRIRCRAVSVISRHSCCRGTSFIATTVIVLIAATKVLFQA